MSKDIDVKNWFLAASNDLRSSNMMEVVASEFKVQGLEIDWAVVCWDADLRRSKNGKEWDYYSFRGSKWNKRRKRDRRGRSMILFQYILMAFLIVCAISVSLSKNLLNSILIYMSYSLVA